MPRGFLVKRFSKTSPPLSTASPISASSSPSAASASIASATHPRVRRYSDEDRSDTSSDHESLDPDSVDSGQHRLFCRPGPPPLRNGGPQKSPAPSSDAESPSPPLPQFNRDLCQEAPLALTTEKCVKHPSFTHPVLFFRGREVPRTPPPPLKSHTSPATVPRQKCRPTKKRPSESEPTKKAKAARKLNFDEDKSSPVSGTFIADEDMAVRRGDIDPSLNVVVVSEEARAELAKIENKIGDYVCRLCKEQYDDAFGLAQHRCSRIVHVEYRCPECDKVFNCPANLASHRRWHKPRPAKTQPSNGQLECHLCCKKFTQHFHLRKHLLSHLQSADGDVQSVFASKGLKCDRCPNTFYTADGLARHHEEQHKTPEPVQQQQTLVA